MESDPIVVDFPLRGEWTAYHTPADRVPSHGTDQLGQRYAYDFMQIDRARQGWRFFRVSPLRYYLFGAPLETCYGWSAAIHAPFAGTVVASRDGWPERNPVHLGRDMAVIIKHAVSFNPANALGLAPVLGNYVVLRQSGAEVYALMAHARTGSIRVLPGHEVACGQHVADVGHSGNSTAPHLHFQLMDGPDPLGAQGLPCCFRQYDVLRTDAWVSVTAAMPRKREFVRVAG